MAARLAAAVVLAGGRATRLGGADKARVILDGQTLLERTLSAIGELSVAPVIVGPESAADAATRGSGFVRAGYRFVRESPVFAGPASALATGVAALASLPGATLVTVLPCDLQRPHEAVRALERWDAADSADGAILVSDGRRQWTSFRARLEALQQATAAVPVNESLRGILSELNLEEVSVPASVTADLDTLEQLRRVGARLPIRRVNNNESRTTMSRGMHPDLEPWVAQLAPQLGVDPEQVPLESILDMARDVAHEVVRPGAPVTAFMIGLALGQGRVESVAAANALVRAELERHSTEAATHSAGQSVDATPTDRSEKDDN